MKLSGSQIIIECLKEQNVDTVFGYPGSSVLPLYDELYKNKDCIRHILTSHEQGAAHAADGYARSTGKTGVCIATSGPGATNLVTGIATAYMDSVPIVAITGNVPSYMLGKDSFQEVDIAGITMPITKQGYIVKDTESLANTIRKAFSIARSGRPGPVLVDITKDCLCNEAEYINDEEIEYGKKLEFSNIINENEISKFNSYLKSSKKPLILIGGGVNISGASGEIKRFVDFVDAPVCETLMGRGAFSDDDERNVGMTGIYGTACSNILLRECDLLIAVGTRFSERVTGEDRKFAENAKIIQFDIDPAEVNKNIITDMSIMGDIQKNLSVLNDKISSTEHPAWMKHVSALKKRNMFKINKKVLNGPYIINKLCELTHNNAIITTEVGQHQMWASQFYSFNDSRSFITSGGLGTMGYGLPAAIGAKLGNPDKKVINIAGDGCFRMNMNELVTASRHNIPIIQLVFDNRTLGMVYQWQKIMYDSRFSNTELKDNMDFVKLAEGLGVKAFRISKISEVENVLCNALSLEEPVVIDCMISSEDMVASGMR